MGLFLYNSAFAEDLEQAKAEGYKEALEESANENQLSINTQPDPKPLLPPAGQIPQNIISLGEGDYFSKFVFIADKTARTMSIWQNENHHTELVAAYPFDMGKKSGDKTILGDLKTPEGIYFFNGTRESSETCFNPV